MERLLGACLMMLAAIPALAQDGTVSNDTPAAEASSDKAESTAKADVVEPTEGRRNSSRHRVSRPRSAASSCSTA